MKTVIVSSLLFISLLGCKGSNKAGVTFESQIATMTSVELGKALFFDPRLSSDGTISCNSCHNVMAYGTDSRSVSAGVRGQRGGRSAPSVFNATFLSAQFWDGRAKDLADQAKGPVTNPIEMGLSSHEVMIERLKMIPGYVDAFKKVYGKMGGLTTDNVAKAIAAYEDTLVTVNSPYDKFKAGDKAAMNGEQQEGWKEFQNVGCISCHSGDHFAGPKLPVGQGFFMRFPTFENNQFVSKYKFKDDPGRFEVTKKEEDRHMWRVPSLRNIAMTAPYFHNGLVMTLPEAVRVMGKTQLNKDLSNEQVEKIVTFLEALTGTIPPQTMPMLPMTAGRIVTEAN